MQCKTPMALALGMAWGMISPVMAAQQDKTPATGSVQLDEVTVISTRTERRTNDVPATVTVYGAGQIQADGVRNIKDLFRNELDVSVRFAPARFTAAGSSVGRAGNEGINIRGLEGNQVMMTLDGIRVPNSFSFGAFASGRGDFLDMNGIRSVEVLRGPASTQFGSDGLAGAVGFRTLDPADILASGRSVGGFVRGGYNSVDRSWSSTLATALRAGDWQAMLLGSYSKGHETRNKGDDDSGNANRTRPNPVDYTGKYALAKVLYSVDANQVIGLTLEGQRQNRNTNALSAVAVPPLAASSVIGLDGRDKTRRDRVSLTYRYDNPDGALLQKVNAHLYRQNAEVSQYSFEDRNTSPDRIRSGKYTQDVTGLTAEFESRIGTPVKQRLSYGLDWSKSKISGVRDGMVPPRGEAFPNKPFPDTDYTLAGAFLQNEIEWGKFSLIPGLRFDHYKLDPSRASYTGPTESLSDQALTPRFGVVWRLAEAFAPYGQWARGFRAPTPDQVNNGFANPVMNYMTIGNPNLKPEKADSVEIGVRGKIDALRYSFAAYDNRYEDFIDRRQVRGSMRPGDPAVFQYINLAKVRIHGVEARADWALDARWTLTGGVAWSYGKSEEGGKTAPLDSVQPLRVVLGARYDAESYGGRVNVQYNEGKSANRIEPPADPLSGLAYAPPSSTVVDVGVFWKPRKDLTLNANINNLFDTRYWLWSDVRGVTQSSSDKDAYTAPGRNVQISVRYDF
ncbi:TonB-dependent hemoglobin/transferrin/lactoferrin family receptor [Paludibacterium paludis]|uniref:TonB-dependent receptor n=1 Tax=Paludibacterium paludis TaxID=1225769 RepID=A0A918U854_9NEIS|nr:TonB-dependent hemoglobin/transferrin/lactoferrin family receptor [Paludibacterium paludis]GGY09940.1 TonB-dependent receptor [Paludibacterium paludis]